MASRTNPAPPGIGQLSVDVMKSGGAPLLRATLLLLTVVTGLVDAVSFLGLGHIFTANMTGNVVFLAFALAGAPALSATRSLTSLCGFLVGAVLGGQLATRMGSGPQNRWIGTAFLGEGALLLAATVVSPGSGNLSRENSAALYAVIILTALAMGVRNATVRKLAVPDLTTTVLTLTLTGLAADSSLAGGTNPRWLTRLISVVSMFLGAAIGALLLRHSLAVPLLVGGILSCFCAATVFLKLRGSRT